jgi:drug/metabolite transporter (DMT)-like permease
MHCSNDPSQAAAVKISPIYLMLLTVAVLWGANIVMIKYLTGYFTPTALGALRLTTATLVLVPAVFWRHGWVKLSRGEWLSITGVGLCNITLHQLGLSWGLQATSATHGALILALNPLFTMLLAARFASEPLTFYKTIGIIIGLSGVALIVAQSGHNASGSLWGDFLIFLCMLVYVVGSLFVKKSTATVQPLVVTAYSHIIGSLGLIIVALLSTPVWVKAPFLQPAPIIIFLCSSLLATGLGAVWWNTGIQQIGASSAALFLNVNPAVGIIASTIFLHEVLSWQHFLALALVLSGVGLGTGIFRKSLGVQQPKN